MNIVDDFRRHVDAAAGIYYRLDKGLLTGRNSTATDRSLDAHIEAAKALLRSVLDDDSSPLWDYLNHHPAFAAKWDRIERRSVGLPY